LSVQYIAGYDTEWIRVRPPWRIWPVLVAALTALVLAAMGYVAAVVALPWPAIAVLGGSALVLARLLYVAVDQLAARTIELTPNGLRVAGLLTSRVYAWPALIDVVVTEYRGRLSDPPAKSRPDVGLCLVIARREWHLHSEICLVTLPEAEQRPLEKVARRISAYAKRALANAAADAISTYSTVR
jgi:hypothetical protein